MFIIFYGLFLLCMYLPSATEIKDITLFSNEKEVVSPSRLIIPCHFTTDDPISIPNNLLLEWRMSPEGSHSYSTILKLFETVLENVKTANERAQVFVSQVPDGNCSLVINPTYVNDSGTYKVKLTLDGIPYYNTPQIRISVINPGDIQTTIHAIEGDILMAGGVNGNEPSRVLDNDTIHLRTFSRPSCSDYDSDVLRFARKYQRIKKAGLLKGLLSTCFMEFFLLLGNLGALIIGRKYCKLKKLKKEADEEAGEHTEKAAKEGNILEDIPARIIGKLRKTVDMTVEYVKNKAGQKIVDKMKKGGKEEKKVQVSTKEKKEDLGKKEEKVNRRENRKKEEKETKKEKEEKENIKGKEEKEHKRNREYKGEKETKTEKESIKKKVEKEPKEKEKKQVKEIKGEKVQKENKSEKEKKEEKQKKKEVHPPADENMEEFPWLSPKELPPPLP